MTDPLLLGAYVVGLGALAIYVLSLRARIAQALERRAAIERELVAETTRREA